MTPEELAAGLALVLTDDLLRDWVESSRSNIASRRRNGRPPHGHATLSIVGYLESEFRYRRAQRETAATQEHRSQNDDTEEFEGSQTGLPSWWARGLDSDEVAAAFGVHATTARRWGRGTGMGKRLCEQSALGARPGIRGLARLYDPDAVQTLLAESR
jgi:hypothetical protein